MKEFNKCEMPKDQLVEVTEKQTLYDYHIPDYIKIHDYDDIKDVFEENIINGIVVVQLARSNKKLGCISNYHQVEHEQYCDIYDTWSRMELIEYFIILKDAYDNVNIYIRNGYESEYKQVSSTSFIYDDGEKTENWYITIKQD